MKSPVLKPLSFFLVSMMFLSCSKMDVEKKHHQAVEDGYKILPIADSMKAKYGTWSFITHWNIPSDPKHGFKKHEKEWQSLTYIYGRYELVYVQRVILDKNGGKILKTSNKPELYLIELKNVYGDPVAPSTDFTNFQVVIEEKDLEKLIKSDWDFDSIGINLGKSKPLKNISWKYDYWNRIYPLQINPCP